MTNYITNDEELTNVADAIREKGGTTALLEWPDEYIDAIGDIETGGSSDPYPVRNDGNHHLWVIVDDLTSPQVSFRCTATTLSSSDTHTRDKPYVDWGDGSEINNIVSAAKTTGMVHSYTQTGVYEIIISGGSGTAQARLSYAPLMATSNTNGKWTSLESGSKLLAVEVGGKSSASNTSIGGTALFSNCPNLIKVTYSTEIKATRSIGALGGLRIGDTYDNFPTALRFFSVAGPITGTNTNTFKNTSLETIDMSQCVQSADKSNFYKGLFDGCVNLRQVILWSTMHDVGSLMFNNCRALRTINLPASVVTIGEGGFNDCWSLQSVTIPAAVTTIGANAFANCHSLASITFLPTTPPTVADASAWTNLPTTCEIHVPSGTLSAYTAAANYPDPATYTYVEDVS